MQCSTTPYDDVLYHTPDRIGTAFPGGGIGAAARRVDRCHPGAGLLRQFHLPRFPRLRHRSRGRSHPGYPPAFARRHDYFPARQDLAALFAQTEGRLVEYARDPRSGIAGGRPRHDPFAPFSDGYGRGRRQGLRGQVADGLCRPAPGGRSRGLREFQRHRKDRKERHA